MTTSFTPGRASSASLQRLLAWFSPAFPVGAFAYSAGLETAISEGIVTSGDDTRRWIAASLRHGAPKTDAILLSAAWRAPTEDLQDIADLAIALSPARQRVAETQALGAAFIAAAKAWGEDHLAGLPTPCPYPVALGAVAARHGLDLTDVLTAFLTAYAQSQISVSVRLVPIGQTDGLAALAALEPEVTHAAGTAIAASLEDIGTISYAADISAMAHETLQPRIFKS